MAGILACLVAFAVSGLPYAHMKRLFALVLALVTLLPVAASAQTEESIASFEVSAQLQADRTLTVTEQIVYDLGSTQHHGIYRDIPVVYDRNGGSYRLRVTVDDVQMDGYGVRHKESKEGDNLRIRIGDPDEYVTGKRTYVITYHTDRAVNFFDGAGELYWNVTGNGWEVPIEAASFVLTGPELPASSTLRTACFTGVYGSTVSNCEMATEGNRAGFLTTQSLGPEEGLTVVIGFPAGVITQPPWYQTLLDIIKDNGILALPLVVLAVMYWLWSTRGRDPKGRGTVIPQYEPPRGLGPAQMIGLKEQDVPQRAVTATILDLARRGYLKIDFGEGKKYTFIKSREADGRLTPAELAIFEGLFKEGESVELADLKGTFYKAIKPFKDDTLGSLKEKGFFEAHPGTVRGGYIGFAFALGGFAIWIIGPVVGGLAIAALVISALIIAGFGWFMPRVTEEGAVVLEEVEGFKWFLSVTEKDRLKFHNAPQVKPAQFHQFLPAAVAFGVEDQWAEQFKGLDVPPPDYASGTVLNNWAAMNFAHGIGRMNSAAAATAFAAPSSSGSGGSGFSGGGSGGGFGGGGGGSW
jgi:hypothetical protein